MKRIKLFLTLSVMAFVVLGFIAGYCTCLIQNDKIIIVEPDTGIFIPEAPEKKDTWKDPLLKRQVNEFMNAHQN